MLRHFLKLLVICATINVAAPKPALATNVTEHTDEISDVRQVGVAFPSWITWDYQITTWESDGAGGFRPTGQTFKLGGSSGTTRASVVFAYDGDGNLSTQTWTFPSNGPGL